MTWATRNREGNQARRVGATHYLDIDGSPSAEFKKGAHGLMFKWSDDSNEWVRTTVKEKTLKKWS